MFSVESAVNKNGLKLTGWYFKLKKLWTWSQKRYQMTLHAVTSSMHFSRRRPFEAQKGNNFSITFSSLRTVFASMMLNWYLWRWDFWPSGQNNLDTDRGWSMFGAVVEQKSLNQGAMSSNLGLNLDFSLFLFSQKYVLTQVFSKWSISTYFHSNWMPSGATYGETSLIWLNGSK